MNQKAQLATQIAELKKYSSMLSGRRARHQIDEAQYQMQMAQVQRQLSRLEAGYNMVKDSKE